MPPTIPALPSQKIVRFAPSPNGFLHLGHAYSALLNFELAQSCGGIFLLRIEDIDTARCRPKFEAALYEDLSWLGLQWPDPVLRQSTRTPACVAALERLQSQDLIYPCFCSRSQLTAQAAGHDPDGAPLYTGTCKHMSPAQQSSEMKTRPFCLRLDMAKAARDGLTWRERDKLLAAQPELWGDVVLARKDIGTSYHLAVTVDDAAQGVTDVVRGKDLFASTHLHRLLQHLLALPTPTYHHHALLLDTRGAKLTKSQMSKPLREWRQEGATPQEIFAQIFAQTFAMTRQMRDA